MCCVCHYDNLASSLFPDCSSARSDILFQQMIYQDSKRALYQGSSHPMQPTTLHHQLSVKTNFAQTLQFTYCRYIHAFPQIVSFQVHFLFYALKILLSAGVVFKPARQMAARGEAEKPKTARLLFFPLNCLAFRHFSQPSLRDI